MLGQLARGNVLKDGISLAEKPPTAGCYNPIRNRRSNKANAFSEPLPTKASLTEKNLELGDCSHRETPRENTGSSQDHLAMEKKRLIYSLSSYLLHTKKEKVCWLL